MPRQTCGFPGGIVLLAVFAWSVGAPQAQAGDWPQMRGSERNNVSPEAGLLKEWPEKGPPLLWKAEGLGQGVASVAVADGRAFTLGYRGDDEFVTALDIKEGTRLWSARIGPAVKEATGMRWLSQRTPTVDDDRLYAVTARGDLICLDSATGKENWRKDSLGQKGRWGYCDYPLVDGNKLICTLGGRTAMIALNKITGAEVWKVAGLGETAGYSVTIAATLHGTRQYIATLDQTAFGVAAADGKLLWKTDRLSNHSARRGAPLVHDNLLFLANSDGSGAGEVGLLRFKPERGSVSVEEVWATQKQSPASWLLGPIRVGEHVYLCTSNGLLTNLEFATGKVLARDSRFGQFSMTYADSRFYVRGMTGLVGLVEASPGGVGVRGSFDPPRPSPSERTGVFPVVSDGRLYLRDMDWLLCYDVKDPSQRRRGPRPSYVPSPQDVVEKMLELAKVIKDDRVVDLGCGDGRIVITAAKKYGARGIGYDIDRECVRAARDSVKKHDVGDLVRISRGGGSVLQRAVPGHGQSLEEAGRSDADQGQLGQGPPGRGRPEASVR